MRAVTIQDENAHVPGSAGVSRVGLRVSPKQSLLKNETLSGGTAQRKFAIARTQSPARETRALPFNPRKVDRAVPCSMLRFSRRSRICLASVRAALAADGAPKAFARRRPIHLPLNPWEQWHRFPKPMFGRQATPVRIREVVIAATI
jgi:hypothetical protein